MRPCAAVLIGVLLSGCRSRQGFTPPRPQRGGKEGGQIEAVAGKTFTVTLESNPTTGYRWRLVSPLDESVVRLLDTKYEPRRPGLLGAGGLERWTFRAEHAGRADIRLEYVRPWEKGVPPARTARFTIRVR